MAETSNRLRALGGIGLALIIVGLAVSNAIAVTRLVEGAADLFRPTRDVHEFAPRPASNPPRLPDALSVRRSERT